MKNIEIVYTVTSHVKALGLCKRDRGLLCTIKRGLYLVEAEMQHKKTFRNEQILSEKYIEEHTITYSTALKVRATINFDRMPAMLN